MPSMLSGSEASADFDSPQQSEPQEYTTRRFERPDSATLCTMQLLLCLSLLVTSSAKPKDKSANKVEKIKADDVPFKKRDDAIKIESPEEWRHLALPVGGSDARANASLAMADGSVWIVGSTLKMMQYQWLMRAPAVGSPEHQIIDPGRIMAITNDGAGGASAAGVLGATEDRGWFGSINAFGGQDAKQVYLSGGEGVISSISRHNERLVLAGSHADEPGGSNVGWMIMAAASGSETWSKSYGGDGEHVLHWATPLEAGGAAAVGRWHGTASTGDQAWYLRVDETGEVVVDQRWDTGGWSHLGTAIVHGTGDVIAAGLASGGPYGQEDGEATLRILRIGDDGTTVWERSERHDVSDVSPGIPFRGGMALCVKTGEMSSIGRRTWLVQVSREGTMIWTDLLLPVDVELAQLHPISDTQMGLLAVATGEDGVRWLHKTLEDFPPVQ